MTDADWIARAHSFEFRVDERERFYIERRSDTTWAVVHNGFVLCKVKSVDGFIYESMPSNRSKTFLRETRFPTKEAAYKALQGWFSRWERVGPGWKKKSKPAKKGRTA